MPIDESVINLVRSELGAGKKPEDIVEKLRRLDYTDPQIEEIFSKVSPQGLTIISRPSRTTIFKTIFSPAVLAIVVVIVILVGGMYYLATTTFQTESLEEKARNMADSTDDAELFLQTIELQNSIITCIPAYDSTNSELGMCTIKTTKTLGDLGNGKFKILYSIDEDSKCPKNYIKQNDMLEIEVDLITGSTSTKWIINPMLKADTIQSLYPKRNNCKYLAGYVAQFVQQIKN